jgi:hypothetical protein
LCARTLLDQGVSLFPVKTVSPELAGSTLISVLASSGSPGTASISNSSIGLSPGTPGLQRTAKEPVGGVLLIHQLFSSPGADGGTVLGGVVNDSGPLAGLEPAASLLRTVTRYVVWDASPPTDAFVAGPPTFVLNVGLPDPSGGVSVTVEEVIASAVAGSGVQPTWSASPT